MSEISHLQINFGLSVEKVVELLLSKNSPQILSTKSLIEMLATYTQVIDFSQDVTIIVNRHCLYME